MSKREYYSVRTGRNPAGSRLDLPMLIRLFTTMYTDFGNKCYFDEAFGYDCVDAGEVPGTVGHDVEGYMLRKLRKFGLWPILSKCGYYGEDDLFDVIEFLYDHVSKPVTGDYHSWADCGWHYSEFDRRSGRDEFRSEMNQLLRDYGEGYELSQNGEILSLADPGMEALLEAQLPEYDPHNVEALVKEAILKFRRYRSSIVDKREAVRVLADVLEFLRPKLKEVLTSKDESELFNIANNFAIRHHNPGQKRAYDESIWLSWMFYFYLATIHAAVRLIKKREDSGS